mmetsp:Transcript_60504/g.177447  ORF Transcript_60504/g.177447 Transcript_60504/m.177447 type:complete len:218 (+) Transcript_60504:857-1510(+)
MGVSTAGTVASRFSEAVWGRFGVEGAAAAPLPLAASSASRSCVRSSSMASLICSRAWTFCSSPCVSSSSVRSRGSSCATSCPSSWWLSPCARAAWHSASRLRSSSRSPSTSFREAASCSSFSARRRCTSSRRSFSSPSLCASLPSRSSARKRSSLHRLCSDFSASSAAAAAWIFAAISSVFADPSGSACALACAVAASARAAASSSRSCCCCACRSP